MNILQKSIYETKNTGINYNHYNEIMKLYNELFEEQLNKGIKLGLFLLKYFQEENYIELTKIKQKKQELIYLFEPNNTKLSHHLKQYRLGKNTLPIYQDLIEYSKICEKEFIMQGLKIVAFLYKSHSNHVKIQELIKKLEKEKNEYY